MNALCEFCQNDSASVRMNMKVLYFTVHRLFGYQGMLSDGRDSYLLCGVHDPADQNELTSNLTAPYILCG